MAGIIAKNEVLVADVDIVHRCASRLTSGSLNTAKQKQTNKINWAMEMYVEKNV